MSTEDTNSQTFVGLKKKEPGIFATPDRGEKLWGVRGHMGFVDMYI